MPADLLDDKAAVCYNETRTVSVRTRAEEKYPSGSRGSPAKGVDRIKLVRGFKSRLLRQKQSRSNADTMQYIFINGLAGFVAKWQPKPLTYENNYNVRENGKFVRAQ